MQITILHTVAKRALISHCRCGQRLSYSHVLSSGRDLVHHCWPFKHSSTLTILTGSRRSYARISDVRQVTCRPPSHQPIFCNSDSGTRQHKVSESDAAALSIFDLPDLVADCHSKVASTHTLNCRQISSCQALFAWFPQFTSDYDLSPELHAYSISQFPKCF